MLSRPYRDCPETVTDYAEWFALQVRPRQEQAVARWLECKQYETLVPLRQTKRQWSDRLKTLASPLFPGYVFCRFPVTRRLPILQTPGVVQIVGIQKRPVPVDVEEIEFIQRVVSAGLWREPHPYLCTGQSITLLHGPLRGARGILLECSPHCLVASVHILQRSLVIELEPDWLGPVNAADGAAPTHQVI